MKIERKCVEFGGSLNSEDLCEIAYFWSWFSIAGIA